MGTNRTFSDMLNEYLPNSLLSEEIIKMDYVLQRVNKDNNWKGGNITVPFKGPSATSVKFGGLTGSSDVDEMEAVRGSISAYKEVWGTMKFHHADIMQHNKVSEQGFLNVLPDTIEDFNQHMSEVVSFHMTTGGSFAAVSDASNAASGIMIVDRIERFKRGMKVLLDDDDTTAANYYVTAVNLNTDAITLSATRGGSAADVSAFTVAQNAKFYHDGITSAGGGFTSLKKALLSSTNGGDANIHGKSKVLYPFLQAINVSGAAVTASNIVEKIFDAYTTIRRKARGNANEVLMSYKNFGSCMKVIELQKGSFKSASSSSADEYGWITIEITVVATQKKLKFIGIQELDDDVIMFMDWKGSTFRTNGYFQKRKDPDTGKEYFTERATTGYSYLVDICLFGELEVRNPGQCGIMYSISY